MTKVGDGLPDKPDISTGGIYHSEGLLNYLCHHFTSVSQYFDVFTYPI